jgi:hypothetical protein
MTNLIIIGNGFDMAHGLKTSYSRFIEFLINNKFKDQNLYSDLFEFDSLTKARYKNYEDIVNNKNYSIRHNLFKSENLFFKRLTNKLFNFNWCDIEREYFTELSNIGKDARYKSARELNSDFDIIKKYLSEYLKIAQSRFEKILVYEQYFAKMSYENTMILNFNYTNTVINYVKNINNSELVQIHGLLESEENPIIFGYAADDNQSRKLLQFDDKEFMRNIKKHNYKRTKEENRLIQFLDKNRDIEVSIIGHSCGLSDKLILNQIFNNKNVSDIRIYYHKNYEHYFETQVNIDRIMNNDFNFRKLINFQDSIFIPQKNQELELESFIKKFTIVFENRKKLINDKYRILQ